MPGQRPHPRQLRDRQNGALPEVLASQNQRKPRQRTKMKKLNISINLLKIQGSVRATVKGEDCIILRLTKGRTKPHQNGKVYLNLEAVANKNGEDQYGNTHFIVEPTTKEERESGAAKLPIIGNGKEWSNEGQQAHTTAPARTTRNIPRAQPQPDHTPEGDDITF